MTIADPAVAAPGVPAYPGPRDGDPLDPPPVHRAWLRRAPLTRVRLWNGRRAWLVSGHAEVRAVLRSPHLSSDPRHPQLPTLTTGHPVALPGFFIQMDDPEHDRLRRMITPEFVVRRISAARRRIAATVAAQLAAFLAAGPPRDLVTEFAVGVPPPAFADLIGLTDAPDERAAFCRAAATLLVPDTDATAALRAGEQLRALLGAAAARSAARPADDLLSRLVGPREAAGEIDRATAVGLAMMIVVAGHDTVSTTIATGMLALLRHPDQLARLRADPSGVPAAVEELLRFLAPIHRGLPRLVLADLDVAGHVLRAGEAVILDLATANRDPAVFADPDRFDVTRNARAHVGFGFGVHHCVGQTLARALLQEAFTALVRGPALRLAVPAADLRYRHDMTVYGATSVPVTW